MWDKGSPPRVVSWGVHKEVALEISEYCTMYFDLMFRGYYTWQQMFICTRCSDLDIMCDWTWQMLGWQEIFSYFKTWFGFNHHYYAWQNAQMFSSDGIMTYDWTLGQNSTVMYISSMNSLIVQLVHWRNGLTMIQHCYTPPQTCCCHFWC